MTTATDASGRVFSYQSSSLGYMIFCNGQPLGGAQSAGSATRTSRGTRRSWQAVRADVKMHAETARRVIGELAAGLGPSHLRANIAG